MGVFASKSSSTSPRGHAATAAGGFASVSPEMISDASVSSSNLVYPSSARRAPDPFFVPMPGDVNPPTLDSDSSQEDRRSGGLQERLVTEDVEASDGCASSHAPSSPYPPGMLRRLGAPLSHQVMQQQLMQQERQQQQQQHQDFPGDASFQNNAVHDLVDWTRGGLIGQGSMGMVYMGMLSNGGFVAVKQFQLINARNQKQDILALRDEVQLMAQLDHPNIVKYLGMTIEAETISILLEYVSGGSIASILGRFKVLPEHVIRVYTRQILQGLQYLHANDIVHRDIKGANILVDTDGTIKLADFGASKHIRDLMQQENFSLRGTPNWMAPEVIKQRGYGKASDIWSLGGTVVEMATGRPPFSEFSDSISLMYATANGDRSPRIPPSLSAEGQDFLRQCFVRDPKDRATAAMLLEHPFVNSVPPTPTAASASASPMAAGSPSLRRSFSQHHPHHHLHHRRGSSSSVVEAASAAAAATAAAGSTTASAAAGAPRRRMSKAYASTPVLVYTAEPAQETVTFSVPAGNQAASVGTPTTITTTASHVADGSSPGLGIRRSSSSRLRQLFSRSSPGSRSTPVITSPLSVMSNTITPPSATSSSVVPPASATSVPSASFLSPCNSTASGGSSGRMHVVRPSHGDVHAAQDAVLPHAMQHEHDHHQHRLDSSDGDAGDRVSSCVYEGQGDAVLQEQAHSRYSAHGHHHHHHHHHDARQAHHHQVAPRRTGRPTPPPPELKLHVTTSTPVMPVVGATDEAAAERERELTKSYSAPLSVQHSRRSSNASASSLSRSYGGEAHEGVQSRHGYSNSYGGRGAAPWQRRGSNGDIVLEDVRGSQSAYAPAVSSRMAHKRTPVSATTDDEDLFRNHGSALVRKLSEKHMHVGGAGAERGVNAAQIHDHVRSQSNASMTVGLSTSSSSSSHHPSAWSSTPPWSNAMQPRPTASSSPASHCAPNQHHAMIPDDDHVSVDVPSGHSTPTAAAVAARLNATGSSSNSSAARLAGSPQAGTPVAHVRRPSGGVQAMEEMRRQQAHDEAMARTASIKRQQWDSEVAAEREYQLRQQRSTTSLASSQSSRSSVSGSVIAQRQAGAHQVKSAW